MPNVLTEFQTIIETTIPRLAAISEPQSAAKRSPDAWSQKQVLGHLIDSASNNHQRWVRAQLRMTLEFPDYAQEGWVNAQAYQAESWALLVQLWTAYNRHLLHVLARIPVEKLQTPCLVEEPQPVPLESIIIGYVAHLKAHLAQLFGE